MERPTPAETAGTTDEAEGGRVLAWSVFPATQYLWRSLAGLVVIALTVVFLSYYAGGPLIGAAAGLLLFLMLHDSYLPTSYHLDERGVVRRRLFFKKRRPWSDFKCFYCDRFGMMLSTRERPTRLDTWRGMSLWFPDDERAAERGEPNRQAITSFVAEHVEPYRPPVDHRELLG